MKKSLLGLSILLISMLSLQYGASLAKNLFALSGVAGATTLRLVFASLCLIIFLRPWKIAFKKSYLMPIFLYGASLGLMNLSFYYALAKIPLGIAVALEFTGPLLLAVFSSKNKLDYFWVLLASIGIFLLFPQGTEQSLDSWGVFFALFAGLCWALYIIFGKKLSNTLPTTIGVSYGMSVAALFALPVGLYFNTSQMLNPDILLPGLLVGVFASAIPYALELRAMRNLSQKSFSILMSLEPAVATLIGVIFLNEFLNVTQICAIFLIMTASLGTTLTQK